MDIENISRDELTEKIARHDKFRLVEVSGDDQYHEAHLPGAINMHPGDVGRLASKRLKDRDADIVIYSDSASHASEEAARELSAMGYAHVRDYAEGKEDWIESGLPVVSDLQRSHDEDDAQSS